MQEDTARSARKPIVVVVVTAFSLVLYIFSFFGDRSALFPKSSRSLRLSPTANAMKTTPTESSWSSKLKRRMFLDDYLSPPDNAVENDNYGHYNNLVTVTAPPMPDPIIFQLTTGPTPAPTPSPTQSPSTSPTISPTVSPTKSPTTSPTKSPTPSPTPSPTKSPTPSPTTSPTKSPTPSPTPSPTTSPTPSPTMSPTSSPTTSPTMSPTVSPTESPSSSPTFTTSRIYFDSFEKGLGPWKKSAVDLDNRVRPTSLSTDKDHSVLLRNQGFISTEFATANLRGYGVSFDFYVRGMESGEGLILAHSLDGSDWKEVCTWINYPRGYHKGLCQFDDFDFMSKTNKLYLRLSSNGDEKNDHIFLDKVQVDGYKASSSQLAQLGSSASVISSDNFEKGRGGWELLSGLDSQIRPSSFAPEGYFAVLLRRSGSIVKRIDTDTTGLSGYLVTFDYYVRNIVNEKDIFGAPKDLVLYYSVDKADWKAACSWDDGHSANGYYKGECVLPVAGTRFLQFRMNGIEKNDQVFLDNIVISGLNNR